MTTDLASKLIGLIAVTLIVVGLVGTIRTTAQPVAAIVCYRTPTGAPGPTPCARLP